MSLGAAKKPATDGPRILIAEDSPTQRQIIRSVLGGQGYDVIEAEDGIKAVSRAFYEAPDLLILDIDMPRMNGYQVCRLLKEDYRTTHMPVILLTGRDQETDKYWGLKTGADRYVTKGFQLDGLLETVNELLEEARERPLPLVRQDEQPEKGQQEMDVLTRVNDLLDRKLFEATIINEISRLNTISEDSGITINSVLSVIAKVTDCYVGSVLLLEENEMIVHVHNPVGSNFFVEAKLRAIEAAKPYLPSGVSVKQIEVITDSDPGFIEGEKKGCDAIRSIYTSPLSARGKNIAVMTLLSPKPDTFTERVRSTLEIIEPPASVVVDNARLHQGAMKLAITDGLTHLFNHRHFYELLEQEFRRTNRYMSRMALIILDIDYFKKVNDNYGHQVGDDILKELAEVINGEVREIDLVARYGGEEFAVILPQTDTRQGVAVAERIRRNVERRSFYTPEGKIRITISAGVVSFPETAVESQVELVQLADEALYQAKESGRNKVVAGGRGDEA